MDEVDPRKKAKKKRNRREKGLRGYILIGGKTRVTIMAETVSHDLSTTVVIATDMI